MVVTHSGETSKGVTMQKKAQTQFMHPIRFRERERLTDEPSESLPQRIVPALDVCGLTRCFAHGSMLLCRDDQLIRGPPIAKAMCGAVRRRNALPQRAARRFRAVANHIGAYLPRRPAQGQPNPALIGLLAHERPQLIKFERQRGWVVPLRLAQRVTQWRERSGLFLSQLLTVFRETPKVRVRPRKLLRSSYARTMASRAASV